MLTGSPRKSSWRLGPNLRESLSESYPHLTDKETEVQRYKLLASGHTANEKQQEGWIPGTSDTKVKTLPTPWAPLPGGSMWDLKVFLFYRWRGWAVGKGSDLPRVTHQASGEAGQKTKALVAFFFSLKNLMYLKENKMKNSILYLPTPHVLLLVFFTTSLNIWISIWYHFPIAFITFFSIY